MSRDLGAVWLDDRELRFCVWSPRSEKVDLHIVFPEDRIIPMEPKERGYHQLTVHNLPPETQYLYRLNSGRELPDPASRHQPHGVHGPSQVGNRTFEWTDQNWFGIPIEKYLIYELHPGTFTAEGTFDAIIPRIPYLLDVGFTALELMPIAQFPGERNWGYDGVYPFAAQNSYGGPRGLKRLVNACHERGMAVILDVVYNHLGPEGNYFPHFGPYFTDRYKTPWGPALNFDDAHSDEVRHFFIQNALYWITECHIDALRLDAVHAILDRSAFNFLEELAERIRQRGTDLNRRVYTIAESALNDTRLIRSTELGGYAIDAQWNDDFHHALHTLLTKERQGYYIDFGNFQQMSQAFSEGFVYSGRYSATRGRRHGNSSRSIPSHRFVVYAQNHDQVGNRMMGERLSQLVSLEKCKLASAIGLLSPFIPLLFMGDEYGETAPFLYFVSHSDPDLVEAVRGGRKREFAGFEWSDEPPDPQDEATFKRSRLNHSLREEDPHRMILDFHKEVIRLRKSLPALARLSKETMDVISLDLEQTLMVRRWSGDSEVLTIFNFNEEPFQLMAQIPGNRWRKIFDSEDKRWGGQGSSIPDVLESPRTTPLQMTPAMVLVFAKEAEG